VGETPGIIFSLFEGSLLINFIIIIFSVSGLGSVCLETAYSVTLSDLQFMIML
jgi:hypothetical protein